MKKKLIALSIFSCIAVSLSGIAIAQNQGNQPEIGVVQQKEEPLVIPSPGQILNPRLVDNSDKKPSDFQEQRKKLQEMKLRSGMKIKGIKLVSYSEYLDELYKISGSKIDNYEVHPNRQIFIMEVHAHEGFIIPSPPLRQGVYVGDRANEKKPAPEKRFKKAKIYMAFDAETGDSLGNTVEEVQQLPSN